MLFLWRSENSHDKDGDAGNVLHFRSSQTQECEFAAARSEQKKLKCSKFKKVCIIGHKRSQIVEKIRLLVVF